MEGGLKNQRVVVVGGGHNGLTAACYLAGAGLAVTVLERLDHTGGAAVSKEIFPGVDVRLSRYAYLVSLVPKKIIEDLGLSLELISRPVSSYTPNTLDGGLSGLLVERPVGAKTYESFEQITNDPKEADRWVELYSEIEKVAQVLAPTLLEPLQTKEQLRELVLAKAWRANLAADVRTTHWGDDQRTSCPRLNTRRSGYRCPDRHLRRLG